MKYLEAFSWPLMAMAATRTVTKLVLEKELCASRNQPQALAIPTLPSQQPTDTKPLTTFQLLLVAEDGHHWLILVAARNPNCLAIWSPVCYLISIPVSSPIQWEQEHFLLSGILWMSLRRCGRELKSKTATELINMTEFCASSMSGWVWFNSSVLQPALSTC